VKAGYLQRQKWAYEDEILRWGGALVTFKFRISYVTCWRVTEGKSQSPGFLFVRISLYHKIVQLLRQSSQTVVTGSTNFTGRWFCQQHSLLSSVVVIFTKNAYLEELLFVFV
jgi:hypothetical protein